jgi:hypothetical protein
MKPVAAAAIAAVALAAPPAPAQQVVVPLGSNGYYIADVGPRPLAAPRPRARDETAYLIKILAEMPPLPRTEKVIRLQEQIVAELEKVDKLGMFDLFDAGRKQSNARLRRLIVELGFERGVVATQAPQEPQAPQAPQKNTVPSSSPGAGKSIKAGFRDLKWGDPLPMTGGMTRVGQEGSVTYYSRDGDKLAIGKAEITSISYGFFRNQLCGVVVYVTKPEHSDNLLKVLNATWGEGHLSDSQAKVWLWSNGDTYVIYSIDEQKSTATLDIYSHSLNDEIEKADKVPAAGVPGL